MLFQILPSSYTNEMKKKTRKNSVILSLINYKYKGRLFCFNSVKPTENCSLNAQHYMRKKLNFKFRQILPRSRCRFRTGMYNFFTVWARSYSIHSSSISSYIHPCYKISLDPELTHPDRTIRRHRDEVSSSGILGPQKVLSYYTNMLGPICDGEFWTITLLEGIWLNGPHLQHYLVHNASRTKVKKVIWFPSFGSLIFYEVPALVPLQLASYTIHAHISLATSYSLPRTHAVLPPWLAEFSFAGETRARQDAVVERAIDDVSDCWAESDRSRMLHSVGLRALCKSMAGWREGARRPQPKKYLIMTLIHQNHWLNFLHP